ncbi:MAG: hypothetical protein K6E88_01760 [Lachnospiraceae bacterium]|nr:hypothetical protein [Lachnospiraceae bacterium]
MLEISLDTEVDDLRCVMDTVKNHAILHPIHGAKHGFCKDERLIARTASIMFVKEYEDICIAAEGNIAKKEYIEPIS